MGMLQKLLEIGKRNSTVDTKRIQAMHDTVVDLGAQCSAMSEAAGFSNDDVRMLLTAALRKQFKNTSYNYPYVVDVYDDEVVFSADYSGGYFRVSYTVDDSGGVTFGTPVEVVRKVTYVEPANETIASEAQTIELNDEYIQLVESDTDLREAKTRMLKLIAPGWGSSGYYPAAVLQRDGPTVFKQGLHNYIDHPTAVEERDKPEGSINKLASVLQEDAKWYDDYKGNGPGLYAPARVQETFNTFLNDFGKNIGTSIRASGRSKLGEADGRQGPIIQSITSAKSVDYVTIPGAGGQVLELFEAFRESGYNVKDVVIMADEPTKVADDAIGKLTQQLARLQEGLITRDARDYASNKLRSVKLHDRTKIRLLESLVINVPLTESSTIDLAAFNTAIDAAVKEEMEYLTSVGGVGHVKGFGESSTSVDKDFDADKEFAAFNESLKALD